MEEKHPIDIGKEKLEKRQGVTVCSVIKESFCSGVVYQGGFYPDDYLEGFEGQPAFVVEAGEGICIFDPNGVFCTWYKVDKHLAKKGYKKVLNRMLK